MNDWQKIRKKSRGIQRFLLLVHNESYFSRGDSVRYATFREKQITQMFMNKGILTINDLTIDNLCEVFNLDIIYHSKRCNCFSEDGFALIYLDDRLSYYEQRFKFFHEFSHVLFHSGKQKELPKEFNKLQEDQAYWSALYASMPRHIFEPMVIQHQSVQALGELFELPEKMIIERIESIKRERSRDEFQLRVERLEGMQKRKSLQPGKIYDSTRELLKKLESQVGEEKLSYEVKRLLR